MRLSISFIDECRQNTIAVVLVAPLTLSLIETTDIFTTHYGCKLSQNIIYYHHHFRKYVSC